MKEFFVYMVCSVTEEKLVAELEQAISEWKIFKDEERFERVAFCSHLILLRQVTNGDVNKAREVIGEMNKVSDISNMFNNKN